MLAALQQRPFLPSSFPEARVVGEVLAWGAAAAVVLNRQLHSSFDNSRCLDNCTQRLPLISYRPQGSGFSLHLPQDIAISSFPLRSLQETTRNISAPGRIRLLPHMEVSSGTFVPNGCQTMCQIMIQKQAILSPVTDSPYRQEDAFGFQLPGSHTAASSHTGHTLGK